MAKFSCAVVMFLLFLTSKALDTQRCRQDCSTTSTNPQTPHQQNPISCHLQNRPYECGNVTKPNKPILKNSSKLWYLYSQEGKLKIALNISWSPSPDKSVNSVRGYQIVIWGQGYLNQLYYGIDTSLDFRKHAFASFYYDCFGRSNQENIKPGQKFNVMVKTCSGVDPTHSLSFEVEIPNCKNPAMEKAHECQIQKQVYLVANDSCKNRTKRVTYDVPSAYGTKANALFCRYNPTNYFICLNEILVLLDIPLSGSIDLQLPESYLLNDSYSIQIWGNKNRIRQMKFLNFNDCDKPDKIIFSPNLVLEIVASSILVVFIASVIYYTSKGKKKEKSTFLV